MRKLRTKAMLLVALMFTLTILNINVLALDGLDMATNAAVRELVDNSPDYSLNNQSVVTFLNSMLQNEIKTKVSKGEISVNASSTAVISGPYPVYAIEDDGETIEQYYNEYFIRFNADKFARMTVSFTDGGYVSGSFEMVDNPVEGVTDEPHIVIGTMSEAYVITNNGVSSWGLARPAIAGLIDGEIVFEESSFDVMEIVQKIGFKLFDYAQPLIRLCAASNCFSEAAFISRNRNQ